MVESQIFHRDGGLFEIDQRAADRGRRSAADNIDENDESDPLEQELEEPKRPRNRFSERPDVGLRDLKRPASRELVLVRGGGNAARIIASRQDRRRRSMTSGIGIVASRYVCGRVAGNTKKRPARGRGAL
jgi:hypothetical protein